jgi:DNA-nicking Smr family endonuclease
MAPTGGQAMTKRGDSDRELFLAAVADATPLPVDSRGHAPRPSRRSGQRRRMFSRRGELLPRWSDQAEQGPPSTAAQQVDDLLVREELMELITGGASVDVADTAEYVEGYVPGLDRKIVKRLRRGELAVQSHLDLHGRTLDEAYEALMRFITSSRRAHHRCVLVIHGRGLHSPTPAAVLKEGVVRWLSRGRLSREVLAFASARPHDGGAGAVYVLLRR